MNVEITLTTQAVLFPAISLLLVAYTNRFNAISSLIRSMSASYKKEPSESLLKHGDDSRDGAEYLQRYG